MGISCYRLYDKDLPEFPVSIDLYDSRVCVSEYKAKHNLTEEEHLDWLEGTVQVIADVLQISDEQIYTKERRRKSDRHAQYQKTAEEKEFFEVQENGLKFLVNLSDYLDTGLFLDHRPVRLMIADLAKDKRFLNLFCYTATASVHAAMAGARYTVSVDMSNTYLNWARKNYALNGLSESRNRLEQADCLKWLEDNDQLFDLILLDPPSFSNSKRMEDVLDVQRDHVGMINNAMRSLAEGGTLIFSNNLRSFKLDTEALSGFTIKDISAQTIYEDFKRNPKIHQCWLITH